MRARDRPTSVIIYQLVAIVQVQNEKVKARRSQGAVIPHQQHHREHPREKEETRGSGIGVEVSVEVERSRDGSAGDLRRDDCVFGEEHYGQKKGEREKLRHRHGAQIE
jgi:hypothetical protein